MVSRFRFIFQTVFFLFSSFVFLGWIENPHWVRFHHSFFVFPSLSVLAWWTLPAFLGVTLFFLFLPFFFGRFYCSFVCPAGFLQDLSGKMAQKIRFPKKKLVFPFWFRVLLLFFVLTLIFFRSSSFYFFDHFSYLGHFFSWAKDIFLFQKTSSQALLGGIFFIFILFLPLWNRRWFCHSLCPSGTLFSLEQKKSLFRVSMTSNCVQCSSCYSKCPVNCIDSKGIHLDLCIQCLECLEACPQKAIQLKYHGPGKRKNLPSNGSLENSRRAFIHQTLFALAGVGLGIGHKKILTPYSVESSLIIPPGARSIQDFLNRCVGCQVCVQHCPTQVLEVSGVENSFLEFSKIRLNYKKGYCSYECNRCLQVCPTGAISFYPLEMKKQIKIGSSELNKNLCIPYAQGKDCAACQEQCPTGAITVDLSGKVRGPILNNQYCIGCGSCEYACPVTPQKAIQVKPMGLHSIAFNPKQKFSSPLHNIEQIQKPKNTEFPF